MTNIIDFLAQAGATLTGALAAFELERTRRTRKEKRVRIGRVRQALFTLIEQRQFIMNLKQQTLDPKKDDPIRAFSIHSLNATTPSLPLNVEALGFLLNGDGELLNQLAHADLQFRTLAGLLEARSALHLRFQQRLEIATSQLPPNYRPPTPEPSVSEIEALVGRMMSKQLQQMTDELYHIADSALATNRQVFERARQDAERIFKGEKFFKAEELFKVL